VTTVAFDVDSHDFSILAALEEDARQPFAALAERVALSKTPCWNRVRELERRQVIRGYHASLDPRALGLNLTSFVQVRVEFGRHGDFERAVREHPAIIECFTTAGEEDYLLKVVSADVEHLDSLLRDELCRLPGVARFSTTICLKRIKETGSLTRAAAALAAR
jgi:Lrp/AsnC family leucine-responsive transcriptional regulator